MLKLFLVPSIIAVVNCTITTMNSRYFLKIPHSKKIAFVLTVQTIAFMTIGASSFKNDLTGFGIALAGTFLIGISFSLGELTMLGKWYLIKALRDGNEGIINFILYF